MGFLDKLDTLKEALNDVVGDVVEEVTGEKIDDIKSGKVRFCGKCGAKLEADAKFCVKCGTPADANDAAPTAAAASVGSGNTAPKERQYADYPQASGDIMTKFAVILDTHFGEYEIKQWQSAAECGFTAKNPCRNYDFVLYRGGNPAAVVMLTPNGHDRNTVFLNAKSAAAAAGVSFINFFTHFPNEEGYVADRIKKAL